jgi:DNA polymerase I-like protein with 3'-5' exonuclease and polymerase domains
MKFTAIDIETTSLQFKTGRILGVGVIDKYYTMGELAPIGLDPHTAHNGKFEYKYLRANNFPFNWQFDTLLASSILIDRPQDLDLASVAQHYLGMESWKSDTDKLFKKKNWVELLEKDPKLQSALAERNIYDLKATTELTEVLQHRLDKEGMTNFFFNKLMPAARLLADVEYRGMRIDVEATKTKLRQIEEELRQYCDKLTAWLGAINLNSPIQLKKALRDKGYDLWIWDFKKKARVESTGSESLERLLPNENIKLLIDYKAAIKLKGFLQGWVEDQIEGYIYPSYNIANTRTGRLSCIEENQKIQVPGKEIPIKDIKVGEYVYCFTKEKELTLKRVLRVINNGVQPCVEVKWQSSGTGKVSSLICTPDHKILTKNRGWLQAKDLKRYTKVVHMKRSRLTSGRQRIYTHNKKQELEEAIIKREYFKAASYMHVHHKNQNNGHNSLENLEILTPEQHTSYHAKINVSEGRNKWRHLLTAPRKALKGEQHPGYIKISRFSLLKKLATAKGRLTFLNMDFATTKKKAIQLDLPLKEIAQRYGAGGQYINPASILKAFNRDSRTEQAAAFLGIGTRKLKRFCTLWGISYNHTILSVKPIGPRQVFDLEVEELHNFVASEICVHNCSSPNLQQVPRDKSIRSLFIPNPGKVYVIGDYAQIEVRVAAHYTQDEALTEVFKQGIDFYGSIAINVLGVNCHPNDVKKLYPKERRVAKEIGLSILYGIGAAKLSSQIRKKAGVIISKERCAQIIKDYFIAYPRLLQFRNYIINKIENGEILRTRYGRQYKIDPSKAFSTGVNTIVQGTATDACLFSQLEIETELERLGIYAPMIGIIHDEIIRECDPKDAKVVGEVMERIMCNQGFECPLKFDWAIGQNWGDKAA